MAPRNLDGSERDPVSSFLHCLFASGHVLCIPKGVFVIPNRFLWLVFFVSPLVAYSSSYPYGSTTLPYLTQVSNLVVTVGESKKQEKSITVEIEKIHKTSGARPTTVTLLSEDTAPEKGDLVYIKLFGDKEKAARYPIEGLFTTGPHSFISPHTPRHSAAMAFLELKSRAEETAWAIERLKSNDQDLLFDVEILSLRFEKADFSPELVNLLLKAFSPSDRRSHEPLWFKLSQSQSPVVSAQFAAWAAEPKISPSTRNSLVALLFDMPGTEQIISDWVDGKSGAEFQNVALFGWMQKREEWDEKKESALATRLKAADPRVRVAAIEELALHDFYKSRKSIDLVASLLEDPKELSSIKILIIRSLVGSPSSVSEKREILYKFVLDRKQDEGLRRLAMKDAVSTPTHKVNRQLLTRLQSSLTDQGDAELAKGAALLLRQMDRP